MTLSVTRTFLGFVLLLVVAASSRAQSSDIEHEFVFKPQGTPDRVNLAGSFNGWSTDATPMKASPDGTYRAKVKLPEGVHYYKFVVNGSDWKPDPNGDKELEADDGHGGKNSGVLIGPDARKAPPPKPNAINSEFIIFDPKSSADVNVVSPHLARLRIRVQADDVESIDIHYGAPDPKDKWKNQRMYKMGTNVGLDTFAGLVETDLSDIRFVFKLRDGSKELSYKEQPFDIEMKPAFETPEWAKHAIWYQIFPERFRNGERANDPGDKDYEHFVNWTADWWKAAQGETPGDENFYKGTGNVWKRRYGGDVQGLIWSLPYLKRLGINAIYLNPMFEADSMHKYDTSDYRHIDDNFGFKGDIAQLQGETDDPSTWQWTKSDKLFLDFVAQAHAQGFKVILDGVFNHVGKSHPFFQDVLKNGKSSKYADWFDVRDWNQPIKYIAWDKGGEPSSDGHLPALKKDAARGLADGPREHIMAITKRWLAPDGDASKGVDGWRLDVPGDIPHPFWIEWRKLVKETKPDAYISGEIWTWAQPWLSGDQFDGVMNYRFADASQAFFVNQKNAISPTEFSTRLSEMAYAYPFQVSLVQQNLFDSHDTDRFASMFVNPDLAYDAANRIQDNGPKYRPDKPTPQQWQRMLQAVACQMTFVGAPMIYYGDENGMWSPDDPSNRMPMVWEDMKFEDPQVKFDPEMFATYQRLIAARRQIPALQLGFFRPLVIDNSKGIFAFARDLGDHSAYVVINRSSERRTVELPISKDEKLVDWANPRQAELKIDPTTRPALLPHNKKGAAVQKIQLEPFGTAILAAP